MATQYGIVSTIDLLDSSPSRFVFVHLKQAPTLLDTQSYKGYKCCWLIRPNYVNAPAKEAIYQATVNGRSATQYGVIATIDVKSHS